MSSTPKPSASLARERLIMSYLPLVQAVARRYLGWGEEFDDVVQVGTVGLIKAADRFDPSRGFAFATFAAPVIEGEIRRHLRDRTGSLRIPRELQRMSGELRRCHEQLTAALGRSPTVRELATALAADELEVQRVLVAESARESIPISPDDDAVAATDVEEPFAQSDDKLLLTPGVRALDEREQRIVLLRFHADMTEREIAREVGISQAHVSRLLVGALAKLREELASPGEAEQGDIATDAVISPNSRPVQSADERTKSAKKAGNVRKPSAGMARIGRVGAPQENLTLERYLELPYHVNVRSEHQGERSWWSATVEELPGCTARGPTSDEAIQLLRPAMEAWLAAAISEHREIPVPAREGAKPTTSSSHSGRFLIRMPAALHAQLARAAEREQVSLNRFVTDMLAASVAAAPPTQSDSAAQPPAAAIDPAPSPPRPEGRVLRVALATNLVVVVFAGLVALVLLVLALQRGI